jgi:hypothetical protein
MHLQEEKKTFTKKMARPTLNAPKKYLRRKNVFFVCPNIQGRTHLVINFSS